ncbi:hypothetical protein [Hwanghaeella sp.]|uniref:hypothetical protein n=1 Tax=Hwanghaeella sp. TaxID=2605943 RepID=UPI003CCBC9DF
MATTNIIQTARLSDKNIVSLFNALRKEFGARNSVFNFGSDVSINIDQSAEFITQIKKKPTYAILSGDLYAQNLNLRFLFRRGTSTNSDNMDGPRTASQFVDEIGILIPNPDNSGKLKQPSPEQVLSASNIANSFAAKYSPVIVDDAAFSATEMLQSQFSRMAEFFEDRVAELESQRLSLANEAKKQEIARDERWRANEEKQQFRREELEKQYASKLEALEKQKEELDDRNNTHVRRDLRNQITREISDRLSDTSIATKGNSFARLSVPTLSLGAALVLAYFAYLSFSEFSFLLHGPVQPLDASTSDITEYTRNIVDFGTIPLWAVFVRGIFSSAGAIFFVVYVITWFRKLHEDDVEATRRLEYYGYDISRASWVVETIMDMRGTEGYVPPPALIEGVCRNLFQGVRSNDSDKTDPIELLSELLGKRGVAKFGPNGAEIELTGADIRKVNKQ